MIYWQLPPLLILISLVYSATRHDDWPSIFREAFRWGYRMLGFLLLIGAALFGVAWLALSWVEVAVIAGVVALVALAGYWGVQYWHARHKSP